ncbi:hypothetical protein [Bifidobacterium sp. ESL0790]|uniref:hypothetical protein n=1 Tax=Bifidobacterium sp. ESL0790 TaxID=2983233 RepID=UPI0023F6E7AA|nr:hypothetical protein [Bifidobacterium sp. ESL0790]WEV72264.1 hypothetical protein OZY47_07500 [Bifidobacterium sp. ESL0790]
MVDYGAGNVDTATLNVPESVNAKRDWLGALKAVAAVTGYEVSDQGGVVECSPSSLSLSSVVLPTTPANAAPRTKPRHPNGGGQSASAPATYRLVSHGRRGEWTIIRLDGHKSTELASFDKPQSAVLFLALEMKNPQLTRPEVVRNVASCDIPEWRVPQALADCVGEDNFACGPPKSSGRNVGLAQSQGKWFVYYYREKYNLYHVGFYQTYPEALQAMADMAWSLRCAEEYAWELGVGGGRDVQQAIDMFLTGQPQCSPYDPENRIKIEVPTYGYRYEGDGAGPDDGTGPHDGHDADRKGDELHFSDETEDGLFITEPGDRYRPDRRLLHTFAMMSVVATAITIAAAVVCMVWLSPSELPGCLILLAQGALLLANTVAMFKCVRRLSAANYRLLRVLSWVLLGSVVLFVAVGVILGVTVHLEIDLEPIIGVVFMLLLWDWGPGVVTGKYKEWNMAAMV